MDTNQPIGVIDSGVGGLSVLRALQQTMPHETFLYLGDTARAPYGTRSRETITAFVAQMTDWLEQKGIKQLARIEGQTLQNCLGRCDRRPHQPEL